MTKGIAETIQLAKLAIAWEKAHAVYFPASAHEMAELGSKILAEVGVRYWIGPHGDSITCTKCRNTSNHPSDVAEHYCGFCHVFHDSLAQGGRLDHGRAHSESLSGDKSTGTSTPVVTAAGNEKQTG